MGQGLLGAQENNDSGDVGCGREGMNPDLSYSDGGEGRGGWRALAGWRWVLDQGWEHSEGGGRELNAEIGKS